MSRPSTTTGLALAAIGALLLRRASELNFVDLDLFHEIALVRAALSLGHIPREDVFAYTPTIDPVVHHEWGTGVVLYAVTRLGGGVALILFKYVLVAAIAAVAVRVARLRGARWAPLCTLAPVAATLAQNGFTTIRAQLFTMLLLAVLLLFLEQDRRGRRLWILPWCALHLVWLNMHGGFVVGLGVLGAYALEQLARTRRIAWHMVGGGLALGALVLVNPWGSAYVHYLLRALTMPRQIGEWQPIWFHPDPVELLAYAFALAMVAYCVSQRGLRGVPGIAAVVVCAYLGAKTARHSTLFAIVWVAHVPAWVSETPLGVKLEEVWRVRARPIAWLAGLVFAALLVSTALARPFELRINTQPSDDPRAVELVYPVGAVRYLEEQGFRGNVLTHFNVGSYVMWHLYPAVRVGLDSRYEVAYPEEVVRSIGAFYHAEPGWEATLGRYPTDLVLVIGRRPIAELMRTRTAWSTVYRDDAYEIFARPGLTLPTVDRRGQPIVGGFP